MHSSRVAIRIGRGAKARHVWLSANPAVLSSCRTFHWSSSTGSSCPKGRIPTIMAVNNLGQTRLGRHQRRAFAEASLPASMGNQSKFSHLHFYVEELGPLEKYKTVEAQINEFAKLSNGALNDYKGFDVESSRSTWSKVVGGRSKKAADYVHTQQDVITQLMYGAGWRINGVYEGSETISYQIGTGPSDGVKIVVTAKKQGGQPGSERLKHFEAANLDHFFQSHAGRQGCAVLAFQTADVDQLFENYKRTHPNLLRPGGVATYDGAKILEAYAYYAKDSTEADTGTVIRFVQTMDGKTSFPLPGITPLPESEVVYAGDAANVCEAWPDHWVSNVWDREKVLQVFQDVLGFESKVNFNAGVVGAGAAVIESTVTGNEPATKIASEAEFLKNTDQIFLPINNPLSPHGHVRSFLDQLGQGVQHFASRVRDMPAFISRANRYREVTGEGFAFLNIPRSYYGFLQEKHLTALLGSEGLSKKVLETLLQAGVCNEFYVVDLSCNKAKAIEVLKPLAQELGAKMDAVAAHVAVGRYNNIHAFLQDSLTEDEYVRLVENKILVDTQGNDVLLQIFTNPVMCQNASHQAPFFEFIQRVCSKSTELKPGCGGFGIRNFLTLFLSIEVSNYMSVMSKAKESGDTKLAEGAKKAVDVFTNQLNVSNPVLTDMSDALTEQSQYVDKLPSLQAGTPEYDQTLAKVQEIEARKEKIQSVLKDIGEDHKAQMYALIEQYGPMTSI